MTPAIAIAKPLYRVLRSSALIAAMAAAPLVAVASEDTPTDPVPTPPAFDPMAASNVLIRAISLVGTPYTWGGNTPESGFDCSGLVNYVFRDMLNLQLPRSSRELAAWGRQDVAATQLQTADLVFFGQSGIISHVGIYVGDGRFVHAPSSGGTVRLDRLDGSYWKARYAGAKRVLGHS